jgi:hypothetical protein
MNRTEWILLVLTWSLIATGAVSAAVYLPKVWH